MNEESKKYYESYFGINAAYVKWAEINNISSNALFVLYVLHEYQEECTQKFICDMLLFPKQTVNSILNNFENQGYIEKKVANKDKRNKYIRFTRQGVRYANKIIKKLFEFEGKAFDAMSPAEIEGMHQGNALYLKHLNCLLEGTEEKNEKDI